MRRLDRKAWQSRWTGGQKIKKEKKKMWIVFNKKTKTFLNIFSEWCEEKVKERGGRCEPPPETKKKKRERNGKAGFH